MKVYYSCVLDATHKFHYQCWLWVHSLTDMANVLPSNIWVHYIKGTETIFLDKLLELGVNIKEIECFGDGKYCNKIQQLSNPALRDADLVILMDTDTIVARGFLEEISMDCVSGKVVDLPNPDIRVLEKIFYKAKLENRLNRVKTDFGEEWTFQGNFNGGLYIIPNRYLDIIYECWKKWALWLFETRILHEANKEMHVDQVSFCMTLHENNIPVAHLPRKYNYPIHLNFLKNEAPVVIHYHWELSAVGLLKLDQNSTDEYRAIVNKVNAVIQKHFDNVIFWNYRYSVHPDLGSGIGSSETDYFACDVKFDQQFWQTFFSTWIEDKLPGLVGKKIVLHIGTPKTGTSTLQQYLYENREALRQQKILYPDEVEENRHQILVNSTLNQDWMAFIQFFENIADQLNGIDKIILSSEGFYNYSHRFGGMGKCFWQALGQVTDLNVIVYFRKREDFLESFYRQCVINPKNVDSIYGTDAKIDEFIQMDRVKENLDYENSLKIWRQIAGEGRVLARWYQQDVISDFCELVKIDREGHKKIENQNRSLPAVAVELVRRCNRFLDADSQRLLVKEIKELYAQGESHPDFVDDEAKEKIRQTYAGTWLENSVPPKSRGLFDQIRDVLTIQSSGLFDREYYLRNYPDVRGKNPIVHYVRHGFREKRNPSGNFNTEYYLRNNPDVVQSGLNPFVHYIRFGRHEGRKPSGDAAEKRQLPHTLMVSTGAPNDMATVDLENAIQKVEFVDEFVEAVTVSRETFGWYTKHYPRVFEYPWLLHKLKGEINGKKIAELGAGLSPLPVMLAEQGAIVTTIDNHVMIRDRASLFHANEWGFFDYSQVHNNITSLNLLMDGATFADQTFDVWYSISVIEHMPAEVRRNLFVWMKRSLKTNGCLLLTLDLVKGSDKLWNYSEGVIVEDDNKHGTLPEIEDELKKLGFLIQESRSIQMPETERVDIALIDARLN